MTVESNQGLGFAGCCNAGKGGAPELGAKCRGLGVVRQQVELVVDGEEGQLCSEACTGKLRKRASA